MGTFVAKEIFSSINPLFCPKRLQIFQNKLKLFLLIILLRTKNLLNLKSNKKVFKSPIFHSEVLQKFQLLKQSISHIFWWIRDLRNLISLIKMD